MKKTSGKIEQWDVSFDRWMRIWASVKEEYSGLPTWTQEILLDDISTAVTSRIAIFKNTQKCPLDRD